MILDGHASHRHATLERRLDRWLLVDHGTFSGQKKFQLCREKVVLPPSGRVSFGQSAGEAGFILDDTLLPGPPPTPAEL